MVKTRLLAACRLCNKVGGEMRVGGGGAFNGGTAFKALQVAMA
jgi:hypothetical protein